MSDYISDYGLTGCGDNSCYIAKPTGMGTNGGCRCPNWKFVKIIQQLEYRIAELEAAVRAEE